MESKPWLPKPFTIAVLDSDEYLADTLCDFLRESGFAPTVFYDMGSLLEIHRTTLYDAYVLDYLADWQPESHGLEELVAAVRSGAHFDAPIFILGNHSEPERVDRLSNILMQHKVRYLLKPLRITYLTKCIGEALAKRAGL